MSIHFNILRPFIVLLVILFTSCSPSPAPAAEVELMGLKCKAVNTSPTDHEEYTLVYFDCGDLAIILNDE